MEKEKILVLYQHITAKNSSHVLSQINNAILEYIDEIIIVNNLSTDARWMLPGIISNRPELPCRIINNDSNYNLGAHIKLLSAMLSKTTLII